MSVRFVDFGWLKRGALLFAPIFAVVCFFASTPAHAVTVNSLTLTNLSDADYRYYGNWVWPGPTGYQQFDTNLTQTGLTATTFSSQFTGGSYAEAQTVGTVGDIHLDNNMGFRVEVGVDALAGEEWDLTIDSQRFGAVVERAQGHDDSYVNISDVTFTHSWGGYTQGTLDNTGQGTGGNWQPDATAMLLYDDCSDANVCGQMLFRGTGSATVTLEFNWNVVMHSDGTPGVGDSDEVGYMFGEDNTLYGNCCYLAGDFAPGYTYSGVLWDSLLPADGGHFLTGSIAATVPEPGTALIVGAGLLGLAARRRKQRQN